MTTKDKPFSHRAFARGAAGLMLAGPALAQAGPGLKRRVSGLANRDWRDHFDALESDAILCDINDRVLHYWGADGFYRICPTSAPLNEDMTRRGRTEITFKRPAPEWRPHPEHDRAQPRPAALRRRRAGQPAGRAGDEPSAGDTT